MTILLGILLKGWGIGLKLLDFLKSLPWQVYAVLGAIVGILLLWHVHTSEVAAARAEGYAAGVADTKAAVKAAQDKADAVQRAKNAVHEQKSSAIDTEKTNAFLDSTDAIDRRAAAIRMQHDAANHGAGGLHPLPETIVAPGGIAAPATCDGLSFDAALDVLTRAARLQAQLNAVLDWEDDQDKLAGQDDAPPDTEVATP